MLHSTGSSLVRAAAAVAGSDAVVGLSAGVRCGSRIHAACHSHARRRCRCLSVLTSQSSNKPSEKRLESVVETDSVGSSHNVWQDGPDALAPADNLITWKRGDAVRIRMDETAPQKPKSVMTFLRETVERLPNKAALASKTNGSWIKYSYEDYYNLTRRAARSFIELGLEPQSAVGIVGFNSTEWVLSSLGAIFAGGYSTGIYQTNSPDACHYVANHARCNVIVVEDDKQLQKILSIRHRLPHLRAIVQYRGQPDRNLEGVYSWSEFMALGSESIDRQLEARIRVQAPNKCCMLIYTSGTTGSPKGVMLSHDNVTWTASRIAENDLFSFGDECRFISYLPLSHVAAQIAEVFAPISIGGTTYFAQPDALQGSLGQTIKEVRPNVMLGVPRVWEKMHEAITKVGKQNGLLKRQIIAWARNAGMRGNVARMNGQEPPLMSKIADQLILRKIRQAIGVDQVQLCISAAAPISRSTLDFFISLNIPMVEVLGMTELSGPHTVGITTNNVVGSVGPELRGTHTTIRNPNEQGVGELLMHSRNVCMGYLDMEDKTVEAFGGPDGTYLHSGDLGRRDERGFLHVSGRIKELLITAGGENIPCVPIEDAVKVRVPILSQCVLIGDRRRFLSILITVKTNVDPDTQTPLNTLSPEVVSWCRSIGSDATTVRDVINDDRINDEIQKAIEEVNQKATSNAQRIQKFTILPTDFSIAGGELGPTLKLRRHFIMNKYSGKIESMYDEQPQQIVARNINIKHAMEMSPVKL